MFFSLSDVAVRRGVARAPVSHAAFVTVLIGVPLFALASLLTGQLFNVADLPGRSLLLLAGAGLVHYIAGRYFNYAAISAIGAARSSPVQALSLPYSVLIALVFLDESVTLGMAGGIARRKMITRSAGFGLGAFGLGAGVFALGGMVRNPWAEEGQESLLHTGWMPEHPGEKIYLRRDTGNPHDVSLLRPEDIDAGGFETVFPFREAWRHDEHELITSMRKGDAPVMLIRLRPGSKPVKRKGQEDFNYGDYYAYSKICTHLGCPTSLFEQQTGRLLCPCHQSQFDVVNTYAKPVFGPATRALPQLPITVDEDGYFVAKGDFIEPVGPAYWERKS